MSLKREIVQYAAGAVVDRGIKKIKGRKPRLGSGKRFAALKRKLASRPGVTNPGKLAAWIGRKKWGAKRFAALSRKGKS